VERQITFHVLHLHITCFMLLMILLGYPMEEKQKFTTLGPLKYLWHQRLGHPSNAPIQLLSNKIPEIVCDPNHVCDVCPLAKQTRLFFSPSTSQSSTAPFDLIHCDIWGPHKIHTHTGAEEMFKVSDGSIIIPSNYHIINV